MFILVDCNNFYASCEKVFNPKLLKCPVVVLSVNDGCVIARSKEAKALNIPMGAPFFKYKELFLKHSVVTLSSNFPLYGNMSSRVMDTLKTFGLPVEVYSIDEAFLLLEEPKRACLKDFAMSIRKKVLKWTGIPTSVGIAQTKTLAKLAASFAKKSPEGVFVIEDSTPFLKNVSVGDVWGIGAQTKKKLFGLGVFDADTLVKRSDAWVRKQFSVTTLRTVLELKGRPSITNQDICSTPSSISVSRSFTRELSALEDVREAVATFIARAAKKLRSNGLKASFVSVYIRTNRFKDPFFAECRGILLPLPTSYTPDLIQASYGCLTKIFFPGLLYKKVGIVLSHFVSEKKCQYDLFETDDFSEKKGRAMAAFDRANKKYASSPLFFGAEGIKKEWKNTPKNRSPKYTTDWNAILKVRCKPI